MWICALCSYGTVKVDVEEMVRRVRVVVYALRMDAREDRDCI